MEDTEPFVYLGYLTYAIFFISLAFMMIQGAVDSTLKFNNLQATEVNVGMAKNFYLMNQGERFGKFESSQLENIRIDSCRFDIPGYVEQNARHKIDDSCQYSEGLGINSTAIIDGETRTVTSIVPEGAVEVPEGDS